MCGIAGIVSIEPTRPVADLEERLGRMAEAQRHRGPDDGGTYRSPSGDAGLANRRLAVIDLTPAGRMPMGTDDGRYWITYNGEIYNFAALRRDLEARGHRFHSHSDTEVVLYLYAELGERCVELLNGMFAFAIWDSREHSLFLARDRLGIKPLYCAHGPESFLFASEIRGILASGLIERHADPVAVSGYLTFGSVPDERTIIRGVSAFPPAHCALLKDGVLSLRRYWSHGEEMTRAGSLAECDVEEAVREELKAAVARQLVSDAPLGLFLSGGMDSSMLAACVRAAGCETMRSVSISFDERELDESEEARAVAERFGLEHVDLRVGPADVSSLFDQAIGSMDQPSNDAINTYFVSGAARAAGLTVALSGLGADELFGGYSTFADVRVARNVMEGMLRLPAHDALASLVCRVPYLPRRARKLASWMNGSASLEAAYVAVRGVLSPGDMARLAPHLPRFEAEVYVGQAGGLPVGLREPEAVSMLETRLYMHNQLLRDTDAMSMAHSLEVRVPFLDNELISMAARARGLLGRGHKPALAAARALYFPVGQEIGPKRGFTFPLAQWLRGPLQKEVRETLSGGRVLDRAASEALWQEVMAGRRHWSAAWTAVALERWLAIHDVKVAA